MTNTDPTTSVLMALFAASLFVADAPAQQAQGQRVTIDVDWSDVSDTRLDSDIQSIMVRRFHYARGFAVPAVVRQQGDALYNALEQEIRRQIQTRRPDIVVLREDTAEVIDDDRQEQLAAGGRPEAGAARADAFIVASIFPREETRRVNLQETVGESALRELLRRKTGGFFGPRGGSTTQEVRYLSLQCSLSLGYYDKRSVADYAETLTERDETACSRWGRGTTTADFDAELDVYQDLVRRHAGAFVDRVLGVGPLRRIELDGCSPACVRAAAALNEGDLHVAMKDGVDAKACDHQAKFVAALAYHRLGKVRVARTMLTQAMGAAEKASADTGPYRRFQSYLDALERPRRTVERPSAASSGDGAVEVTSVSGSDEVGVVEVNAQRPRAAGAIDLVPEDLRAAVEQLARDNLAKVGVDSPDPEQLDQAVRAIVGDAVRAFLPTR